MAEPHQLRVCVASGCLPLHSAALKAALAHEVTAQGRSQDCEVKGVGCLGLCQAGPLVSVQPDGTLYQHVAEQDAAAIVASVGQEPVAALRCESDAPFFSCQVRTVTEHCGEIDPESFDEYVHRGGYSALGKVLARMTPAQVIDEIMRSGLRGRGGAGYPAGLKWSTVAKATGDHKYVICNADEGDPGAFMDRTILESDPHRVLEGMAIAAYAVGADRGYIYVRAEYPLAVERLKLAIGHAERNGFLGSSIAGTLFGFHLEIRIGAGAYVCGEETALIASIEGKPGRPRPRPPYPAEYGLWGAPTLINNVETFANIVPIVEHGADWFAAIGTERSKGTKVFALTGSVTNTGVVEVPMGITLREIVFDIGGGIPRGRKFKAIQTGGPAGGCIPEQFLDMPVDYDNLKQIGSMMGSGGMIVMDDSVCMVDLARYFMEFCMHESCGKCIPCRVGTVQLYNLLSRITELRATHADLAQVERLCALVQQTSLCGLGQGAPNPILSTLRYFRDEYLEHIEGHRCPAGVCRPSNAVEVAV